MKAIKNLTGVELSVDYNFNTYTFSKDFAGTVNEEVYSFLKETYPLAFDFEHEGKKTDKPKVTKTPVRMITPITDQGVDMMVHNPQSSTQMFNPVDNLPENGKTDKEGVSWYGETVIEGGK